MIGPTPSNEYIIFDGDNGTYILPFNLASFVHEGHHIRPPNPPPNKASLLSRAHFSYVLLLSRMENEMKNLKRNGVVLGNNNEKEKEETKDYIITSEQSTCGNINGSG